MPYPELELGLHAWGPDTDRYIVELRYSEPGNERDVRYVQGEQINLRTTQFDLVQLDRLNPSDPAYGRLLTSNLFADEEVCKYFYQARAAAERSNSSLRLRIVINPTAMLLYRIRWETLLQPDAPSHPTDDVARPLATSGRIWFSRYLSSSDYRPLRSQQEDQFRALIVISNPSNLSDYSPDGVPMPNLDVQGEVARAKNGLEGRADITDIGLSTAATLQAITNELQLHDQEDSAYDLLYIACHGHFVEGVTRLWLQKDDGTADIITGSELEVRLNDLQHPPRLIVLAACQGAGNGESRSADKGVLASLGPRLVQAGIPAVIAMQSDITMETVARFMPVFYEQLMQDGQVDRAMAAARNVVSEQRDSWVPTLITSLRGGRIWYKPTFASARGAFLGWPGLIDKLKKGDCTPILGPGMLNSLIGPSRMLARRWAKQYYYPMAQDAWQDLPQVAQYLASDQDKAFVRSQLRRYLWDEIIRRNGAQYEAVWQDSNGLEAPLPLNHLGS